jgi:hypothetical protein
MFSFQAGVLEMTWVVSDFTATCAQELSVMKGQQVEVVEVCSSKPDYCLVRMPTRGTDHDSSVPEGLVPLAVLKQPPAPRSSPSRRAPADHELGKLHKKMCAVAIKLHLLWEAQYRSNIVLNELPQKPSIHSSP